MNARKTIAIIAAIAVATALSGSSPAAEPAGEKTAPEDFSGFLSVVSGPLSGRAAIFSMRVVRWSTPEERRSLFEALKAGGTTGLVKAMEDLDVGFVRFPNTMGWRLRIASSFDTSEGRKVRLVTDRPIAIEEYWDVTRTEDYPVGVIEFVLPPEGAGEGFVIPAAKVELTEDGKIEVTTPPLTSSAQRLSNVTAAVSKKKAKKKTAK